MPFAKFFMSRPPHEEDPPLLWLLNEIFGRIHDIMEKLVPEKLSTREDRVKRIFQLLIDEGLTIQSTKIPSKSQSKSSEHRTKGNTYFLSNNLDNAYEEYTKSVAWAPAESQELSMAYANRSAVLFKANYMIDCVEDIDRALANNYPDNLKAKLYLRKANCLQASCPDNRSSIDTVFAQAREWLVKTDEKNQIALKEMIQQSENIKGKIKPTIYHKLDEIIPNSLPKLNAENPSVPGLSDAIELTYSKKYGRHCVAVRDIKPGEILGMQKGYTKIIDEQVRYNICWHCARQTWSGLPCSGCPEVIYCSNKCRDDSKAGYHDIECSIMQEFRDYGIPQYHLMALRMVIMAYKETGSSMEQLKKYMQQINSIKDRANQGFTDGVMKPDKFASSQGLIPKIVKRFNDRGQRGERVGLGASILTAFFFAKKIKLLDEKSEEINNTLDNDDLKFLVCFADKNTCLTHVTLHQGTMKAKIGPDGNQKTISSVLLPAFSFFNFSCVPQIIQSQRGDYSILTSIAFIKKGEQIFFPTYTFFYVRKEKREEEMEDDEYVCECDACVHDWPILDDNDPGIDGKKSVVKFGNKIFSYNKKVREMEFKVHDHALKYKKLIDVRKYIDEGEKLLHSTHGSLKKNSNYLAAIILSYQLAWHCGEMPFFSLE